MSEPINIKHPRHAVAMNGLEQAARKIGNNQKYIVIVYDGADVLQFQRQCSFASNAPAEDVAKICGAISKQVGNATN